jgi:hypothetical protein
MAIKFVMTAIAQGVNNFLLREQEHNIVVPRAIKQDDNDYSEQDLQSL